MQTDEHSGPPSFTHLQQLVVRDRSRLEEVRGGLRGIVAAAAAVVCRGRRSDRGCRRRRRRRGRCGGGGLGGRVPDGRRVGRPQPVVAPGRRRCRRGRSRAPPAVVLNSQGRG